MEELYKQKEDYVEVLVNDIYTDSNTPLFEKPCKPIYIRTFLT